MATTLVAPAAPDASTDVERGPRLMTIEEYEAIPDGAFPKGERVALIEGLIYTKLSQNDPHITALRAVFAALQEAFGTGFNLSMQLPLNLGDTASLSRIPPSFAELGATTTAAARTR